MTELSKTDYLKRYLGKEDSEKNYKKKRKVARSKVSRLKILDRDIDIKSIPFGDKAEEEDYDEAPAVAEIIDERPVEVKVKELYESSRWKKLHIDPELSQCSNNVSSKDEKIVDQNSEYDNFFPKQSAAVSGRHKNAKDYHLSSNDRTSSLSKSYQQKSQKSRHDSDSDISPSQTTQQNSRFSTRHDSESDTSPPRVKQQNSHHRSRHDSDRDNSPPRNSHQKVHSHRHDSDSDISPPRICQSGYSSNGRHDSDSNHSSRKKVKNTPNSYSTRKRSVKHEANGEKNMDHTFKRQDSDSDLSPDRIRSNDAIPSVEIRKHSPFKGDSDSDLSLPRPEVPSDVEKSPNRDDKAKPVKTLSGLKAGLQNAETLKRETKELREREKKHISKLDAELSGRNADTVIRDRKTGLKRNLEEEKRIKDEQAKKVEEQLEKYAEWGKGIEQTESKKSKLSEDLYEMSKPLARYCDDEDLEERLKSIIHDEDPMSAYMRKKKKKETPDVPTYNGPPAPPNRFGIPPGYRWDGVDRSNGFEKKYFEKHNTKKAVQEEAYLWSVQNM